jgi:hypothetical protein
MDVCLRNEALQRRGQEQRERKRHAQRRKGTRVQQAPNPGGFSLCCQRAAHAAG